jgi:hypothetical protein
MKNLYAKGTASGGSSPRALLVAALVLITLLGASCSWLSKKSTVCTNGTNVEAAVAYYYRYKDAAPDQSDIAYIESVPAGPRCVVISPKKAPVYPDSAISGYVASGMMKIDTPQAKSVEVQGKADIAVYYKGDPSVSQLARVPLAVENLTGVSRMIETASVFNIGTPACGACPSFPCDGYVCCKRPPC